MTATKRLVLDLPAEQVEMIESRVAGGEFESASAVVTEALDDWEALEVKVEDILAPIGEDSPEMAALMARSAEVARRIDAGLERTHPIEEVFARLQARLDRMKGEEEQSVTRRNPA